ncbi:uncharacterized protein LOC113117523 [Carassius auratus]|uniref:Uncharacterized protein LOC113117523 n=1 Tax=Carassius auratus TaxID=7957 RepID=A0A6P6R8D4_CARAU|nr:uncharacterized protein LOC113117523 [Carassius auratus]
MQGRIEKRPKPWHPFRLPGMCGLRGTTCVLLTLTIIIVSLIFLKEVEKVRQNDTGPQKRELAEARVSPPHTNPLRITLRQGKDESFLCDPISASLGLLKNLKSTRSLYGTEFYFCSEFCSWSDVKAYYGSGVWGIDERFKIEIVEKEQTGMIWRDGSKGYAWLLKITISAVQYSDAGRYYCAWSKTGTDAYQEVQINVVMPEHEQDSDVERVMSELPPTLDDLPQETSTEDIEFIMSSDLSNNVKEVRTAKARCEGNYACALALLQRGVLKEEIDGECWICMQLHSAWKTHPVTSDLVCLERNRCDVPSQMSIILQMTNNLRTNRALLFSLREYNCSYKGLPFNGPAFHVQAHIADLCICSNQGKHYVGMSDCKNTITLIQNAGNQPNCTIKYDNQTVENFHCPFSYLDSSPGMIWTCGGMAYYHLDEGEWRGCCYPAILSTGTTVLTRKDLDTCESQATPNRQKREVHSMPDRYNGYKTATPWTTPWENVGWSIASFFPGVGTSIALNKINGLAWQVLSLENDTTHALNLITEEMKKMREAVVQNRLVLDLLTSQQGGVCKMLGVSCCFYIPDNSDNISNIVDQMRESIPEPKKDDSWLSWLSGLWGGWGTWILHTVVPIVIFIVILLLIAPCMMQCISTSIMRSVTALTTGHTYQAMLQVSNPVQTFVRVPEQLEMSVIEAEDFPTDADSSTGDDYVHTYELEPED